MNKEILKNKRFLAAVSSLIVIVLFIIFFATDCSAMVFNNKEYRAYKYAIECVKDDLTYPDTATYPSFKNTTIKKSSYGGAIIVDSYAGGQSFDYAWDISGSGTWKNAFGMTLNYKFTVTVVLDKYGKLWCYKCHID